MVVHVIASIRTGAGEPRFFWKMTQIANFLSFTHRAFEGELFFFCRHFRAHQSHRPVAVIAEIGWRQFFAAAGRKKEIDTLHPRAAGGQVHPPVCHSFVELSCFFAIRKARALMR